MAPSPIALHPFHAQVDLIRYLAYAIVLGVAATLPRPRWIVRAIAVLGCLAAAVGIVQNLTWNGKILWIFESFDHFTYYPRMSGPYVNADHFAALLELTLFAAASEFVMNARNVRLDSTRSRSDAFALLAAVGWLMAVAVISAGVIGSASRGGLIGSLLGLVVFCLPGRKPKARLAALPHRPARRRKNRVDRLATVARAAAPAVVAVVIVVGGLGYVGAESRQILDVRLGRSVLAPDLDLRIHHWRQTLPILADFPLFGVGLRGWREVFPRYESFPVLGKQPNHAHNDYLEWATEVGAIGVVLTILCGAAYVSWARTTPNVPRWIRRAVLASIVALAWHEFFDFGLRVSANAIVLAALLGLRANPRWKDASPEGEARTSPWVPGLAVAGIAAVLLLAWSVRQIREFVDWRRAANGAALAAETPSWAATWSEIGRRARNAGDAATVLHAARQTVERRFLDGEGYWNLALAAADDATKMRALEAALVADPANSLWRLTRARELERRGQIEAARREVVEAFRRDPRPYVYRALSPSNSALGGNLRSAIEEGLRRGIDESGHDPDLLHTVAWFYYRPFERWPEAAESWIRAAETTGDWDAYGSLAIEALGRARQYERAEAIAARAAAVAPANGGIYRALAVEVHLPRKRFDDAEKVLEEGLRRAKTRDQLFLALWHVRSERGDLRGAIEVLERGIVAYPRSPLLRHALGTAFLRLEDFGRAKTAFEAAAALEPRNAQHVYFAGYASERLYALGEARRHYAGAITLDPGNARYRAAFQRVQSAFEEGT